MRVLRSFAVVAFALSASAAAHAQGSISALPRNETLIVENPEGTVKNAGWFNIWAINAGGQSTGLHQLGMDTFWYIDPDHGLDGVWDNSLASEPPIYNDDFTQMTVKLRDGIYWSDGVEFTADDVVFTAETHMKTDGLVRSAAYQLNVESVEAPDPYTVVFNLKRPMVVGLTTGLDRLVQVRRNRLLSLNQAPETSYVDDERVKAELAYARRMFADNGWPVIDVTRRSIEETAAAVIKLVEDRASA